MTIPCEECLVLAMCKSKNYGQLLNGCSLISGLLYCNRHNRHRIQRLSYNRRPGFSKIIVDIDMLMGTAHWFTLINLKERNNLIKEARKDKGLIR